MRGTGEKAEDMGMENLPKITAQSWSLRLKLPSRRRKNQKSQTNLRSQSLLLPRKLSTSSNNRNHNHNRRYFSPSFCSNHPLHSHSPLSKLPSLMKPKSM